MKKYKLTSETRTIAGRTLYRIQALKDFGNVHKDDLGGFIESEPNLSHDGNAWVYGNAQISKNAIIKNDNSFFLISKIGSRNGTTTFFIAEEGIWVNCGCFSGSIEQFEKCVKETHGCNDYAKVYHLAIEMAKVKLAHCTAKQ